MIKSIDIDYSNTSVDVSDLYIRRGSILQDNDLSENVFQCSGYNNHKFWLFWNDTGTLDTDTTGISPYNYYPRLRDISNIEFKTKQGTSSETRNWKIEIFTRKMNVDEELNYSNKYKTMIQGINYNSGEWYSHDISNLKWLDLNDISGNFEFIKESITPPYDTDTNENQQILGILLSLNTDNSYYEFDGKISNVIINFKDVSHIYTF